MPRLIFVLLLLPVPSLGTELPISLVPLAERLIHPERSAPATVESLNNTELSAEISARVEAIPVRVGDRVARDEPLLQLDCREHRSRLAAQRATLSQLEAQRRLATNQLQRARNLNRDRNLSEEELERRTSEVAVADAQITAQAQAVHQGELAVERCEVRAPFPAVVTARLTDVGSHTSPGTVLLRLVQMDELEVSARVHPEELEDGATAGELQFTYLGQRYPLVLRRRLPLVDPSTRTVELRLTFSGEAAPPGASGRLVWRSSGSYLPPELLIRRGEGLGIFLLEGNQARFHPLPQALEGQPARVDLPPDTPLIVEGRQRLQDGDPVTPAASR